MMREEIGNPNFLERILNRVGRFLVRIGIGLFSDHTEIHKTLTRILPNSKNDSTVLLVVKVRGGSNSISMIIDGETIDVDVTDVVKELFLSNQGPTSVTLEYHFDDSGVRSLTDFLTPVEDHPHVEHSDGDHPH